MTKRQEAIVISELNQVMNEIELFKAAISTDWKIVEDPLSSQRIKIIEMYTYLYKHPEVVIDLFRIDKNTFYFDKFNATNTIVSIGGTMIGEDISTSEAIKRFKKRFL